MYNLRYIFIVGLCLVTLIVGSSYINRYFGTLFNFSSLYRNPESRCLDLCPHKLNCAGYENATSQQRCFLYCKELCRLNPNNIPESPADYDESRLMKAFYGTA